MARTELQFLSSFSFPVFCFYLNTHLNINVYLTVHLEMVCNRILVMETLYHKSKV